MNLKIKRVKNKSSSAIFALVSLCMLTSSVSCAQNAEPVYLFNLKSQCLIGGVKHQKWLTVSQLKPFDNYPKNYNVYSTNANVSNMSSGKPEALGYPCEGEYRLKSTNQKSGFFTAIAKASWQPLPASLVKLNSENTTYKKVVNDLLKKSGIAKPVVQIKQVLKTDVQSDGVDDVFIVASYFSEAATKKQLEEIPSYAKSGDYSIVIYRQVINEKVQNDIIVSDIHAQVTYSEQQPPPNPKEFAINSILDLNGDGVMEVTIDAEMHEGQWSTVYELQGNKWIDRLMCGCGL